VCRFGSGMRRKWHWGSQKSGRKAVNPVLLTAKSKALSIPVVRAKWVYPESTRRGGTGMPFWCVLCFHLGQGVLCVLLTDHSP
jgi:hypothetical protein